MSTIAATRSDSQTTPVPVTLNQEGRQVNLISCWAEMTPIVLTPTSSNAEFFQQHFEKSAMMPMRVVLIAAPVIAILGCLLAPAVTLPLLGVITRVVIIETVIEIGVFSGIVQPLIKKVAEFIIPYFSTSNVDSQRELAVKITRVFTSVLFAIEQTVKFFITLADPSFRGLALLAGAAMGITYHQSVSDIRERAGVGAAISSYVGDLAGSASIFTIVGAGVWFVINPLVKVVAPPAIRV